DRSGTARGSGGRRRGRPGRGGPPGRRRRTPDRRGGTPGFPRGGGAVRLRPSARGHARRGRRRRGARPTAAGPFPGRGDRGSATPQGPLTGPREPRGSPPGAALDRVLEVLLRVDDDEQRPRRGQHLAALAGRRVVVGGVVDLG